MTWKPGDPVSGKASNRRELDTPHEAFLTVRCPDAPPEAIEKLEPVRAQVGSDGYDSRREQLLTVAKHRLADAGVMGVRTVVAVLQEDERGLVQVMFLANKGARYVNGIEQPPVALSAFFRGTEFVHTEGGW
jgi:hypothetical protein